MQLDDWNCVSKDMNTLKYECNLQNNLYFHWMQLINAMSSNWKIIIKQNNDSNAFTTSEHYFVQNSGVLTIQKITLKDLYCIGYLSSQWSLSQPHTKMLWKKIVWSDFRLEINLHDALHCFQQCLHELFKAQSFEQCPFSKLKTFFSLRNQTRHYVLLLKRKMKLYSIFIFNVQTLEISDIN